ncbi:endonuclease [Sporosarcina sp. ZBG7A]|uniref:endonuclease n=1 Tax=Sporosarcina sp. ZBG7A TaxID=1582223 RepID=UPI00068EE2C3|nr:endonuclease [Sporosarcina sp. ZBG7A]
MHGRTGKKWFNSLMAATLVTGVVAPAIPVYAVETTAVKATDLLISEYIEGSSFNKSIELYNGTGATLDLSGYSVEMYANGATAPTHKLELSGTLENGKTYVVVHNQAVAELKAKADLENGAVTNYNGDDAIVLKKGNAAIDSIGQVGSLDKWGVDVTLVRNKGILKGDSIIDDAFDRAKEWTAYPKDTFTNLGAHDLDGSGSIDPEEPEAPAEVISISDARALQAGQNATVKGIVAAKLKNTISIQDGTGGIAVRPPGLAVEVGDEVTVTGKIADFRGLLQLDGATLVKKESGTEPKPKTVKGKDIGETVESQLVTVNNVTLTNKEAGTGSANFIATDGSEFTVRDENDNLGLQAGMTYDSITGIVQQFDDVYQVIPRGPADVIADSTVVQPVAANPGSGTFVKSVDVTLTSGTVDAEILYTLDGTDPIEKGSTYATPLKITDTVQLKAVAKTEDGRLSAVQTFDYTITDALQIHDIQGEGHESPFAGQVVDGVQGIVTYKYELLGSTYYHIQTPDSERDGDLNTSEAVVLYSGRDAWNLKKGDLVSVTGQVSEYAIDGFSDRQETDLKTTQINVREDRGGVVKIVDRNVELPEPFIIDESNLPKEQILSEGLKEFNPAKYAGDFWESREAMLVEVGNVKAVAPQQNGDLATVLETRKTETKNGGILLKKDAPNADLVQFRMEPNGPARDFEVATGDFFKGPTVGVVGYSYQNYKIYVGLDDMKSKFVKGNAAPETTTIVKDKEKLTLASYNLENFSNNTKSTSADKAKKLARAFAVDMQSPDIVGVTEVQDNNGPDAGGPEAYQSYERLIQAIVDAGGVKYEYVNIDPVNNQDGGQPNANIRVGFLYNPERVSMKTGAPHGDAVTAVGYENGGLTVNPGRIDPKNEAFNSSRKPLAAEFTFQGEDVIVIANHWNSKGGDTPLFGSVQPPVYNSEIQRKKIAHIVYDFIKDVKTKDPDANVVSLGDFNDFQFTDALKIHEGELMTNLVNKVEESDRYSYVYQGNSQVLDHVLVSNNLADAAEIDMLHVNADYTDMAGRASDHDPVMVQLSLVKNSEVKPPIVAEKSYSFTSFKTKKLLISKPSVDVMIDGNSIIIEGVLFTGEYAKLHGEGFKTLNVHLKPVKSGAIIDFAGTTVKKVIVDGTNIKEIRGAENVEELEFINGASASQIKITNSKGGPIEVPSLPDDNEPPNVIKEISDYNVSLGKTIEIPLNEYFKNQVNKPLRFNATKGSITNNTLVLNLEEGTHIVGVTAYQGDLSATLSFTVTVAKDEESNLGYYSDAIGKEGQALKTALHDIISDQRILSYSNVWDALKKTDEDPNNPNNVILLYSGASISKSRNGGNVGDWNREHVWAKSHGDFGTSNGPGTDIHHLRPTDVQVNSSRGSLDFDNGGTAVKGCNGCLKTTNSWEPPDRVKGDVARMIFYMATRYEKGDKVDLELNEKLNNGKNPYHGKLSVLLQWHEQDPIDEFEQNRNNMIFEIQGNRNPFIDHPEWVELIWKSSNVSSQYQKAS